MPCDSDEESRSKASIRVKLVLENEVVTRSCRVSMVMFKVNIDSFNRHLSITDT